MSEAAEDGGGRETRSSLWWWFSLNRESGGPAYHPHQHLECPFFVWYFNITIGILVFIFPLVACLVIVPSFRHKNWSSFLVVSSGAPGEGRYCWIMLRAPGLVHDTHICKRVMAMVTRVPQVLLCLGTGFLLTVVYGSSSWLVGEATVNVSVGPLMPPVPGKLGVWAGLWHVNLTYDTDSIALNERVDWVTRQDLVDAHRKALREGWPWALVRLTAELGGEGVMWRGQLGDGIMAAGQGAWALLVAAMAVWGVWVLLFTVSPQLAARPLIFSGVIMSICSFVYVIIVHIRVPHTLVVAGTGMKLHLGIAWWMSAALGFCLTLVGVALIVYDVCRPGQLATNFELDFGSPLHRLNHSSWGRLGPLHAFNDDDDEVYSQYTWPRLSGFLNESYVLTDDEETARSKKTKCERPNSKRRQRIASMEDPSTPHGESRDKELSEALKTPALDNVTPTPITSTLAEGETHTAFSPPPDTLRRRSPDQPQEQKELLPTRVPSLRQRISPTDTPVPDPRNSTTRSLSDNHSTILVEKHHPKTHASLRTHVLRSSTRSCKFHPRFSLRLSYRSPMRRKSLSLSRLSLYSETRQPSPEEEDDEMGEWEEECEEEDECQDDAELGTKRESATSL